MRLGKITENALKRSVLKQLRTEFKKETSAAVGTDCALILDVDIRWRIFLVMLYSKAIAWRRTLTAKALHLGSDLLIAHGADGGIVGDDFTMTCHDDFGQ